MTKTFKNYADVSWRLLFLRLLWPVRHTISVLRRIGAFLAYECLLVLIVQYAAARKQHVLINIDLL